MREHYSLTEKQYNKLIEDGITIEDLFYNIKLFDPYETNEIISKINIYYYIDSNGDFNSPPLELKHKKIARAIFNSLNIDASEKIQILEYIEDSKNNFDGDKNEC